MENYGKRKMIKFNYLRLAPFLIVFVIILITIGYSANSSNLAINNAKAVMRAVKDVRITNVRVVNLSNGALLNDVDFSVIASDIVAYC